MYYYIITNGEYSDYHIERLIVSDVPIMADDWKAITQRMEAWLESNTGEDDTWYLDDEKRNRMYESVGLQFVEYGEYQADPRSNGDNSWVVWNNLESYNEAKERKGWSI